RLAATLPLPLGEGIAFSVLARDASASRRRFAILLVAGMAAAGALALGGCAGYRFGAASLYPPDIQTVYVPMFESNSFRRNLSEWLTEAVIKEIELKTPYKVVGTPQADSVLIGKLTGDTKRVIVEDAFDQPREVEVGMAVEVRWVNRKGDLLNQSSSVVIPQDLVVLSSSGMLVTEYGQSVSTAQLESIQRLATQIVSLMEMPW
ncbi:MAG TPA: LptE family protein, partial [Pirellulales bacterium]|nr:LptE family protein [Pirellulales bacterium]